MSVDVQRLTHDLAWLSCSPPAVKMHRSVETSYTTKPFDSPAPVTFFGSFRIVGILVFRCLCYHVVVGGADLQAAPAIKLAARLLSQFIHAVLLHDLQATIFRLDAHFAAVPEDHAGGNGIGCGRSSSSASGVAHCSASTPLARVPQFGCAWMSVLFGNSTMLSGTGSPFGVDVVRMSRKSWPERAPRYRHAVRRCDSADGAVQGAINTSKAAAQASLILDPLDV